MPPRRDRGQRNPSASTRQSAEPDFNQPQRRLRSHQDNLEPQIAARATSSRANNEGRRTPLSRESKYPHRGTRRAGRFSSPASVATEAFQQDPKSSWELPEADAADDSGDGVDDDGQNDTAARKPDGDANIARKKAAGYAGHTRNQALQPVFERSYETDEDGNSTGDTTDSEVMIDNLPRLLNAAEELCTFFETIKQRPGLNASSQAKNLARYRSNLNNWRSDYTQAGEAYIDTRRVASILSEYGGRNPQDIAFDLSRANLASLLLEIAQASSGREQPLYWLQRLDEDFPIPFSPTAKHNLFEIAFVVRVQRLIATLDGPLGQQEEPEVWAARIFCENAKQRTLARTFQKADLKPLANVDINASAELAGPWRVRLESLRVFIEDNAYLTLLKQHYSWDAFLDSLASWAIETFKNESREESPLFVPHNGDENPQGDMVEAGSSDNLDSSEDDIPVQRISGGLLKSLYKGPATSRAAEQLERQARDSVSLAPPSNHQAGRDATSHSQALQATQQEDDDVESEFEQDRREPNKLKRTALPSIPSSSLIPSQRKKRTRLEPLHPNSTQGIPSSSRAHANVPIRASQPPFTQFGPSPSGALADSRIESSQNGVLVSQDMARRARRQAGQGRPTQRRVFWSEHDKELLVELIAKIGCNWATIAASSGFEHPRDQIAVRDRARNQKVLFLQADLPLPKNFDDVFLGEKERNNVKRCNRNPDRKEADVNADGNVVNYIYQPDIHS